jgi:hypothetical protein
MAIIDLKLPKYTVTLPISKVKVEYKPFTVKEEKILLLAQEEQNTDAIISSIGQIITNCTFGKHSIDSLNKIDAEYLFVQLRNKSMGEGVEIRAICKECKHKTPMTMNLDTVEVVNINHNSKPIQLLDDVWVTLKYPSIRESMMLPEEDGTMAIAMSLDTIIEGESVKSFSDYTLDERIDFVESLTKLHMLELNKFFENFPVLILDIDYTCKCGHENKIHIEGIENFFG